MLALEQDNEGTAAPSQLAPNAASRFSWILGGAMATSGNDEFFVILSCG